VTSEVPWVAVGRVTRAHGVRGEVAVLNLSEVGARFEPGAHVWAGESGSRRLTVAAARPHRDRLLVRFDEVPDRTSAEALSGLYLFVPAESSPDLPEGAFWPHQLIGASVVTESGRDLGTVAEIVRTPANDVWVARRGADESLIPALRDVVASVDVAAGRVVVREIPGLTVAEA
jgi:16S rRNA processing protein RimM